MLFLDKQLSKTMCLKNKQKHDSILNLINFRRCSSGMWSVGCLPSFWRQESKITIEIRARYKSRRHRSHCGATCPRERWPLEGVACYFKISKWAEYSRSEAYPWLHS